MPLRDTCQNNIGALSVSSCLQPIRTPCRTARIVTPAAARCARLNAAIGGLIHQPRAGLIRQQNTEEHMPPTAAELTAKTQCRDLEHQLANAQATITELQGAKMRLNALIVLRDNEIDRLNLVIAGLQAELDVCRAGLLELPY